MPAFSARIVDLAAPVLLAIVDADDGELVALDDELAQHHLQRPFRLVVEIDHRPEELVPVEDEVEERDGGEGGLRKRQHHVPEDLESDWRRRARQPPAVPSGISSKKRIRMIRYQALTSLVEDHRPVAVEQTEALR